MINFDDAFKSDGFQEIKGGKFLKLYDAFTDLPLDYYWPVSLAHSSQSPPPSQEWPKEHQKNPIVIRLKACCVKLYLLLKILTNCLLID